MTRFTWLGLLTVGMISSQAGAAVAKGLFEDLGAPGAGWALYILFGQRAAEAYGAAAAALAARSPPTPPAN